MKKDFKVRGDYIDMKIASMKDIEDFASDVRKGIDVDVEKVILYGSYARDEHDTGSDIDLAFIVSDDEVDTDRVYKLVDQYRREKSLAFSPRFFEQNEFNSKLEEGQRFYQNVDEEGVEI